MSTENGPEQQPAGCNTALRDVQQPASLGGQLPEPVPVQVTPYIKEVMPADLDSESRTPPDADEEVPSTPASGALKRRLRPVRLSTLAKPATTEADRTHYEKFED